jgi:hypothetical protein
MAKRPSRKSRSRSKTKPALRVVAPPAARLPLAVSADDQRIAREALGKRQRGEKLSQIEQRALTRVEKERERVQRWDYYRTIPKGHWKEMSGRQDKVLNEQAGRYGIPLGGPVIDLTQVVTWLHQFLADKAAILAAGAVDDPLMVGDSPALERYRTLKADLLAIDLAERQETVIDRAKMHERLARMAAAAKGFNEKLERKYGRDAADWFEQMLEVWEREAEATAEGLPRRHGDTEEMQNAK